MRFMQGGCGGIEGRSIGGSLFRPALLVFAATAILLLTVLGQAQAQTTRVVDDDGFAAAGDCDDATTSASATIQAAVNAAAAGDIVEVCDGTYNENVTINKNLKLVSENGRDSTTIEGISNAAQLGTIYVTGNTSGVQIGDEGQGFTIIGIDSANPASERAAIYFNGTHSGTEILDNEIRANGEHGLISSYASPNSGFVISGNEFSGKTFAGPNPAGSGFGNQFTLFNVPRQLLVMGNGPTQPPSTTNITVTDNQFTGTAGGFNTSNEEQGNTLATIDAANSTITGNTFAGETTRFGSALRVRQDGTDISNNTFDSSRMTLGTTHLFLQNNSTPLEDYVAANAFDRGAYENGGDTLSVSVSGGVGRAAAGDTVNVLSGTYNELVNVNKADLTLLGAQAGNDARGRTGDESVVGGTNGGFNVTAGGASIDGFTVQGVSGSPLGTGISLSGTASGYEILNNVIRDNTFGLYLNSEGTTPTLVEHNLFEDNNASGSASGNGIYADQGSKNISVNENEFTGHTNSAMVFAGNSGAQSGLDITGNELVDDSSIALFRASNVDISGNDSSASNGSGIFLGGGVDDASIRDNSVTDAAGSAISLSNFGDGPNTNVEVLGNTITGNARGVSVGNGGSDGSLGVHFNRLFDNVSQTQGAVGVRNQSGAAIDAENNWWGCNEGPNNDAGCDGTLDTGSGSIDADPWLVLGLSSAESRLHAGGTSLITASLVENSDGDDVGGDFPDGTLIDFATNKGSVSPAQAPTADGEANTTLTAEAKPKPGPAKVTSSLDAETVEVRVDVRPGRGPGPHHGPPGPGGPGHGPGGPGGPPGP